MITDSKLSGRTERDSLGTMDVPSEALYGIHSLRARNNFPDSTPFPLEWYVAMGQVKLACYLAARKFSDAVAEKHTGKTLPITIPSDEVLDALEYAATEVSQGMHFGNFIVPGISGGAGTSINMNVNEIIANAALLHLGKKPGEYAVIDPIEAANIYQSTNDVVPTALKVAVLRLLNILEESINILRQEVESSENRFRNELRIGYTQMQEAVPSSFGRLFSTYSEALSRDWWRVSKCFERIKVVNLGGSAIGTGTGVPRFFIMEVVPILQGLTNLPVTRSENLPDATSNLDSFVEIHAILKSHAVNLEKMVSDIRLLASDVHGKGSLKIPQKQVGSSIMPGKINPVIPEFVVSIAHQVYSNDQLICSLCAQGCLELNAYLPIIGLSMINSLKLLISADNTLRDNLFHGISIEQETGYLEMINSPVISTVLSPLIGYHKASLLASEMKKEKCDILEANRRLDILPEDKLKNALKPENLLKTGFTLNDIID
jgi:aspartate ammonia-lyase